MAVSEVTVASWRDGSSLGPSRSMHRRETPHHSIPVSPDVVSGDPASLDQPSLGPASPDVPSVVAAPPHAPQAEKRDGQPQPCARSDGTFEDACDADGNLIKYSCELMGSCQLQGACNQTPTGKVISRTTDCSGTYVGGVCSPPCPSPGEALLCKSIASDGSVTLEEHLDASGLRIVSWRPAVIRASYDCSAMPQVGLQVIVTDPGDAGPYCTVQSLHLVVGSTAVDPHCAYDCQVPP